MADLPKCRRTSWAEADSWAETIAQAVRARGHVPETIVALTRGGWVPGRLLADRLGVKRMVSIRLQHWGVTAQPSGKAELTEGLSGPVRGQSVLVVDDITDTGESLALATNAVREAGASRVESAACLHIGHSKFLPDYIGEEIPRDAWVWVVFPWNYWEDVRHLVHQAMAGGLDADQVRAVLRERSGLDLPLDHVARSLEP
ncbi:MAG: phosphoribosyltransferase [Thermoplasmata archaeon]|nr:phosphoribosyltransferase [Thermoplasmata archaeon]MCI4356528.1 phosphoribosyltransferase [Thermoplasmata archaeon]